MNRLSRLNVGLALLLLIACDTRPQEKSAEQRRLNATCEQARSLAVDWLDSAARDGTIYLVSDKRANVTCSPVGQLHVDLISDEIEEIIPGAIKLFPKYGGVDSVRAAAKSITTRIVQHLISNGLNPREQKQAVFLRFYREHVSVTGSKSYEGLRIFAYTPDRDKVFETGF